MVFGDFYIFLSVLNDFFGQIVLQTGEEMEGHNEPASRLIILLKLAHSALNQLLLKFVEFFAAIERIGLETKLFADWITARANGYS